MAFTCPRCSRTSHGPADEREGYCGACRDFTGRAAVHAPAEGMFTFLDGAALAPAAFTRCVTGLQPAPGSFSVPGYLQDGPEPPAREYRCGACGAQFPVPASHSGPVWCACRSPQPMLRVPGLSAGWSSGEVTISHTDNQSGSPEGTDWPGPFDVGPFGDAMQWSPGDAEW